MTEHIIVTGASRSGKSEWAEQLLVSKAANNPICYVAPGNLYPDDASWQKRLDLHRQRRPSYWQLMELEHPHLLLKILDNSSDLANNFLLIDSLGSWVSLGLELTDNEWLAMQAGLLDVLSVRRLPVVLVSEEVGWGVVPATVAGGCFRDRLGSLARACASCCIERWLVCMGEALPLHRLCTTVVGMN